MNSYSDVAMQPELPDVWRLPTALYVLGPEATALLDQVNERAWATVDPALLEIIRLRIAWLLGNTAGMRARSSLAHIPEQKVAELPAYATSPLFSALDRDGIAFAEQFVMDVTGTSQESLEALRGHLGSDHLRDFVTSVYLVEFTQRLQLVAQVLLPSVPDLSHAGRPSEQRQAALREMLGSYQDAVVRSTALNPVTTELVRLRCARTHNCRICQTLRLADAQAAGVDSEMTSKIDFYETSNLPELHKIALRITDAFIIRPDPLSADVVGPARATFSPEQLAELCLDITKWSTQKIHVALGTDGAEGLPTNEDGVVLFGFQDDGRVASYWADPEHPAFVRSR
jgi:alkylhydroperoxidase family enzyme